MSSILHRRLYNQCGLQQAAKGLGVGMRKPYLADTVSSGSQHVYMQSLQRANRFINVFFGNKIT